MGEKAISEPEIQPVWALGTMSGTSLDGVDVAMIRTDGIAVLDFGASRYRAYTAAERSTLRSVLGCWPGDPGVAEAADLVDRVHVGLLKGFPEAEVIGFHGQTLAHAPRRQGTHQAGSGANLADRLERPVIWDFRSADVAAGGQGAPLAPVYHHALARSIGGADPVVFLNLGGVANLTWVDPTIADPFAPGAMLAFDTGPANAPIDDLMVRRRGLARDGDGALAATGQVSHAALGPFLADPFFDEPPPKSLDRNHFTTLVAAVEALPDADAAATLVEACVTGVARGVALCPGPPVRCLVTGGGRMNRFIMGQLAARLPCPVAPVEEVGLDGDMLEAQAFAFMAVRVLRSLPISGPGTTGAPYPLTGGRVSGWAG